MITEITVDGDEGDLRSLADWLCREPSLRSAAVSLKQAPAPAGAMGGWVEAVQIVTDNGWQAASFVLALMTWRQTRVGRPPVTIRHGDIEVSVPSGDPQEAARIAVLLEQSGQAADAEASAGDAAGQTPEATGAGPEREG